MNKCVPLFLPIVCALVMGCSGEDSSQQPNPVTIAGTAQPASPAPTPIPVATPEPSLEPTAQAVAIEDAQGIYLVDAMGGSVDKVSESRAFELAWTPDGAALWYSTVFHPAPSLWRVGPAEVRAVDVVSRADELVWSLGRGGFASAAPATGRVAFVRHVGRVEDTTSVQGERVEYTVHVLDPERGEVGFGSGLGPQVSPDGSRLLYVTPACADLGVIKVVDIRSGVSVSLAENLFSAGAQWLSDGRVLFKSYKETPGLAVLHVWSPTTGAVERLDVEGIAPESLASLSPDGTVALIHYLGRTFLRDMTAGTQKDLGEGYSRDAEWAADSLALAYVVNDDARLLVKIVSRDGAVQRTFEPSQDPRVFAQPSSIEWSPSGDKLAVAVAQVPGHGTCT